MAGGCLAISVGEVAYLCLVLGREEFRTSLDQQSQSVLEFPQAQPIRDDVEISQKSVVGVLDLADSPQYPHLSRKTPIDLQPQAFQRHPDKIILPDKSVELSLYPQRML